MDLASTAGYVAGFPDTLNLRDLGGWPAADGRHVRHGLLYRGSALVGLDDRRRALVDGFGLRFILDLRAEGEAEGVPDYVPTGAEYLRIGGMYDNQGREVDFSPAGIMRLKEHIQEAGETFLIGLYASMMFDNPALHALVDRFVAGQAPLYFHCTAGKDRTGVSAALLLSLLGVSDECIMQDYLLTNAYRAEIINLPREKRPSWVTEEDHEHWAQMNGVQREALQASLDAADERYGSREAYFLAEFGLGAAELAALRDHYLA